MKVIILSVTQYKEKDAIVEAIGESGDISFLAKGVLDPKNKNAAINNTLSVVEIELREGNYRYPILKTASVLLNPLKLDNDYDYLASLLIIAEATKRLLQEDEKNAIYQPLLDTIFSLKESKEPWKLVLVYFAHLFRVSGHAFEVNHCVFCGVKQGIVSFSFPDGGFVCQNCMSEEIEKDLTNKQMLLIRAAVNCKDIAKFDYDCSKEDVAIVLDKFFEFVFDYYGIMLKNSSLFRKE